MKTKINTKLILSLLFRDLLVFCICVSIALVPMPARAQVYGTVESTSGPPVFCPTQPTSPTPQFSCMVSGPGVSPPTVCLPAPTAPPTPYWPPNDGCVPGTEQPVEIKPGQIMCIWTNFSKIAEGFPFGSFTTDCGADWDHLSLPGTKDDWQGPIPITVNCPQKATKCKVAPWQFPDCPVKRPGGANQYQFSVPLSAKPCKDGSPVVKHVPAPVPVPEPETAPVCNSNKPFLTEEDCRQTIRTVSWITIGVIGAYCVYQAGKWTAAVVLAPPTGGASLGCAATLQTVGL